MAASPAASRFEGRLLHRRDWLALGVHSRRLASREFYRVAPGYLTPAEAPASLAEIGRVLQHDVLSGCPITHSTAALLHSLPLPSQLEGGAGLLAAGAFIDDRGRRDVPTRLDPLRITDPFAGAEGREPAFPIIHVARAAGAAPLSCSVQVHRTMPRRTMMRSGVLVSDPLETLRELADLLPIWDLVAAIDRAIGPSGVLAAMGPKDILDFAESAECRYRPGAPRLRRAASLARRHVESVGETHMRLLIAGAGLPEPVPNLVQRITSTGRNRRLDGALPEWGIGLEYDGSWRRTSARQWRLDEARRDDLAAEGWDLRRFTYRDRRHPLEALLKLRGALIRRGAPVPTESSIRSFVSTLDRQRPSLLYGPLHPDARGRSPEPKHV